MTENNIRIRNNATVTEICVPKERFDNVQRILSNKQVWYKKKNKVIEAMGFRTCFCCVCNKITSPLYEVRYSDPEVVRLEIYCSAHIESVYQKVKDKTNEEIAESYGCQIVEEVPPTIRQPWD